MGEETWKGFPQGKKLESHHFERTAALARPGLGNEQHREERVTDQQRGNQKIWLEHPFPSKRGTRRPSLAESLRWW